MTQFIEACKIDKAQLEQEFSAIQRDIMGPPRRMATSKEIESTNVIKDRLGRIAKRTEELQHSITINNDKKSKVDSQLLSLAKQIAVLKGKVIEHSHCHSLHEFMLTHSLTAYLLTHARTPRSRLTNKSCTKRITAIMVCFRW